MGGAVPLLSMTAARTMCAARFPAPLAMAFARCSGGSVAALALPAARAARLLRPRILLRRARGSAAFRRSGRVRVVDAVVLQDEVERPRLYVGARDDDGHGVTEAVTRTRTLAHHRILILDVGIVIVDHGRDVNQSLNAVLELDEDAKRRHAADDALVGLAHELRHVLDFFHIGRLALRLDGDALTRRGVFRRLGEERTQTLAFLRRDMPRGKRLAQETMHEEVGVASDRRGKMRIVARRKAKVPKARRRIARLLHRTQGDGPDDALLGLSLDAIEHLLDVGGAHLAVLIDMEAQTKRCEEALQTLDLLRGGRLMHAVDERLFLQLHVARHGLICREHALLDDGLADRARTLFERDGMSIGIELYLDLGQLKVNRAAPMTLGAQHLAQTAQRL